ncbi:hypothetical protein [Mariniflexile sp. AS56]|uniref:hypothetical protein n=1 Tax=Mariniflexile sp. AS56 TaxID=3063957 RepID=UPI0026EC5B59|nr:hypothetical protein [Mariniflexile sp. AS56]MDO7172344.1 hypothetical protein [Mariniflexile sp. AS56]
MASYRNHNAELDRTIARLEHERKVKLEALKVQFEITSESIKPVNILKGTFQDFQESPGLKKNLLKTAASITGGYLSKKVLFGKSQSIFKKLIGYVFQYGVTHFISKKATTNF